MPPGRGSVACDLGSCGAAARSFQISILCAMARIILDCFHSSAAGDHRYAEAWIEEVGSKHGARGVGGSGVPSSKREMHRPGFWIVEESKAVLYVTAWGDLSPS